MKKKLYSYDIWDTILKRYCIPKETIKTSVYIFLLYYGITQYTNDILERIFQQEKDKYKNKEEYYIFDLIYQVLKNITCPNLKNIDKERLKKIWDNIYISVEKNSTYPNKKILVQKNKDIGEKIYISDFYIEKEHLDNILNYHNINFDKGYVSCDENKNKYSGELYKKIKAIYNNTITDWIHTGDNKTADIKVAKLFNIKTRFVSNYNIGGRIKNLILSRKKKTHKDDIINLSYILIGFSKFILEECTKNKVNNIYFFTREGVTFEKFFNLYLKELSTRLNIDFNIKTHVLPVSRIATISLRLNINEDYLGFKDAILQYGNNTDTFLSFFNLSEELIHLSKKYKKIEDLLTNEKDKNILIDHILNKKNLAINYLESLNFFGKDKIIVDIGWRGSIQDNLSYIDKSIKAGCYLGIFEFFQNQNCTNKVGYIFDSNIYKEHVFHKGVGFWETIFNAKGGSVTSYIDNVPIKNINDNEELFLDKVMDIQDIIYEKTKIQLNNILKNKLSLLEIDTYARDAYKKISKKPSSLLADLYISSLQNESYGLGTFKNKKINIKTTSLIKSLFSKKERKTISNLIKNNGWRESIIYSKLTSISTKISALIIK